MRLIMGLVLAVSTTLASEAAAQTVVATIDVGENPFGIAVDAARDRAYVTLPDVSSFEGTQLGMIDTSTNELLGTVEVGLGPAGVAVDPMTGLVYVVCGGANEFDVDNRVFVVDPLMGSVTAVIELPEIPVAAEWIAIDADSRRAYVTTSFGWGPRLAVLDLDAQSVLGYIEVGDGQGSIAVDSERDRVYIGRYIAEADTRLSEVVVIDGTTNTVADRIPLSFPLVRSSLALIRGLTVHDGGRRLLVSHRNSDLVSVVDLKSRAPTRTVRVGRGPHGVLYNTADGRLYAGNAFDNTVSVIAPMRGEVVATVPAGVGSRFLALEPDTQQLYVTNIFDTTVSVIQLTSDDP